MKSLSKDQKTYLYQHILLVGIVLLYWGYHFLNMHFGAPDLHCFLKEWFGIYCPLCGGTRCLLELARLHFLSALRYNAYVALLAVLLLFWEIATLIRFFAGKEDFFPIPKWVFFFLGGLLLLFFAFRTILLLEFGIDLIGDLT